MPARNASRAARELALVVLAAAVVFALAGRIELYEMFSRWSAGYERWQVDELPLALLCLSAGLAWFAWRRWHDQRTEAALRAEAERLAHGLLERNRALAQRMVSLQEEERRVLARELHDDFGQCCNAIRVDAACVLNALERDPAAAAISARAIASTADALQESVHRLLQGLRPEVLDAIGLGAALAQLCSEWERRHGIPCSLTCDAGLDGLPEPVGITAYRLVQEALTNIARHANASWARVSLERTAATGSGQGETLRLSIRDNGGGMPQAIATGGLGLLGMRERAGAIGGTLSVDSQPGRGVRIEAALPIGAPKAGG